MHKSLLAAGVEARLLDAASIGSSSEASVFTPHLAKGLEFDRVIVADASVQNHHTELDRNPLYLASTRAMHRMTIFTVGDILVFYLRWREWGCGWVSWFDHSLVDVGRKID